eukprot:CAMPEP_0115017224 /NCGR_PEP_ID=MMETSP0216-20121206/27967_1 /TAXON_ID=223996 /ORGANISM="Protocruzia adherens, Strain Boccale" /LENGTH=667 /DNA_ID=CAMNT_0002387955 /DNA_START=172 /DNA_END=2172 /DNA_ORIENTATION=+
MTGAGKTHTMLGDIYHESRKSEKGLCVLAFEDVFKRIPSYKNQAFHIKLSYLEIYNEQVKDLLCSKDAPKMIVEDPVKGVFVPDLTEFKVDKISQVLELIISGNKKRTMAATGANQFSSRSHAILQMTIEQHEKIRTTKKQILTSKFSLIDLAGSERASTTDNRGQRLIEGANINRRALGNCINTLADKSKKGSFVPYRDSKLTRLLKDSLGGNTHTTMIACISPSVLSYEETINTLKYASRARDIKRKITKNVKEVDVHVSKYKEVISDLKTEIDDLKEKLTDQISQNEKMSAIMAKDKEESFVRGNTGSIRGEPSSFQRSPKAADTNTYSVLALDNKEADEIMGNTPAMGGNIFEKLSRKLIRNFEEQSELRGSLDQLETLKKANVSDLQGMKSQIQVVRSSTDNLREVKEFIKSSENQITILEKNMKDNESIQDSVIKALQKNQEERTKIEQNLASLRNHPGDQDYLDLQIALRLMKLDQLELHSQNMEFRREAELLNIEKEQKDAKIRDLESELDLMRRQLEEKDQILRDNFRRQLEYEETIQQMSARNTIRDETPVESIISEDSSTKPLETILSVTREDEIDSIAFTDLTNLRNDESASLIHARNVSDIQAGASIVSSNANGTNQTINHSGRQELERTLEIINGLDYSSLSRDVSKETLRKS